MTKRPKEPANAHDPAAASQILAPIAYSVSQACAVTSLNRSLIYELIRSEKLAVTKVGRRTLILASSLRALLGEAP